MSNIRALFNYPESQRYLLTHSIGLMPSSTQNAFEQHYFQPWSAASEDIWSHWLSSIDGFNQSLAGLLNSKAEQFCPQVNVSSGLTKVLGALPKNPSKNVILATESDFPSVGFVLKQAERLGFKLKLIPKDQDVQSLATWESALSNDVYAVLITQVHYNTNLLAPVESIAEVCRSKGIVSIVDAAQGLGIVPIDLSQPYCDILIGSCIKWLGGGAGAGFLWLDKNIIDQFEPIDVGWFSHQNPFEFDINNFEYADNASRFWGGTPSVAPYVTASNSIKLLDEIGIPTIAEHNRNLTAKLLDNIAEPNIISPKDLAKKGGTVVLKFAKQGALEKRLRGHWFLFDSRQYGLRLSPHIYTSDNDIEQLIECIDEHTKLD